MEYLAARSRQEIILKQKQKGDPTDRLLLVEHPHVFTLGLSGKKENLLNAGAVPCHSTGRGGDITYHGPGQLVIYPLVDLKSTLRKKVHTYLQNLEMSLIETLSGFDIQAVRRPPWTGVWIGNRKIASIGIAVRKGITYHGAALNVNSDLSYFNRIVPCGLPWAEMTSMARELERALDFEQVKEQFVESFIKRFRYSDFTRACQDDTQTGSKLDPQEVQTISV
ncbi:MAG: lipoyl(octanoyl) transferase LipB [Deltaproteobacteria bacterium]|nr:lipoyl(octanoyl) transferase LipB [Deltaproteobacteria bacterium]